MVTTHPNHETVFTVLGLAARRRGVPGLVGQLVLSTAVASAIIVAEPQWWSLGFLAGWSAAYSAWGLLVRVDDQQASAHSLGPVLKAIAAVGTALAIAGIIGIGFALYTGDALGAKNSRCVPHATSQRCVAQPRQATGPLPWQR